MTSTFSDRSHATPGTAPGTLRLAVDAPAPKIEIIGYGEHALEEGVLESITEIEAWRHRHSVVWVDVDGHGSGEELRALAEAFGLHPLALEDVVNTPQRPKVEPYDDHLFIIARMPIDESGESEQVSVFLGDGWLLTIQEQPGDCFEEIRQRLERGNPRIRQGSADYLAYALLDALVDAYFPIIDQLGDELETIENEVLEDTGDDTVPRLHVIRRRLLTLRKTINPHREMVNTLLRDDSPLISDQTSIFLRDVYDHVMRLSEFVETYRELSSDIMAAYMTAISNRMNEVMKLLTIIATIFIPLSFIAGLYGMNFDPASPWNMPELRWRFGYPLALGLMAGVAGAFIWWIRRKGWFD